MRRSPPDVAALYPPPFYDPFTTLTWLAGETDHIELGTSVAILPFRSPVLTARMVANVDQFSGGRFVLGVGAGWSRAEFAALGVSFDERGAITDEYLTAVPRLWSAGQASMRGQFVSFHEVRTGPSPVRRTHPPIWVGGSGRVAIQRTAQSPMPGTRSIRAWNACATPAYRSYSEQLTRSPVRCRAFARGSASIS
jgi:probable F420-dependent oxidoreductase